MATEYSPLALAAVILVIGVLTYGIRLSFIALFGRVDEVPAMVERALRFVPPAVLAALVAPAVIVVRPEAGGLAVDRLLAGGLAAGVAWRTKNVFATMAAGMATLWLVRFLL